MPVRSLNDLRNDSGPQNQAMPQYNNGQGQAQVPRGQNGGFDRMQGANIIVVGDDGDPEDNAVFPSMSKTLARNFNRNTFIFYITIIQIAMFIVELLWGQIEYGVMFDENNTMAGPGVQTMDDLGAKVTYKIQDGQLYRLVLPAILHGGILHIFMNLFFQTMLCYTYELKWGTGRMAYFYFMTAVGSSLMSAVNSDSVSVGASGSLFGMLGVQIAYLIMNWNVNPYAALGPNVQPVGGFGGGAPPPPNQMEMCQLVCIIIMNFTFSQNSNDGAHIDNWAHGGGLISGFLIGFPFVAKAEAPPGCFSNIRYVKLFFLMGTCLFYGLLLWELFFNME